ncbi:MAG TPA: VOC family protein, partial [Mycobacterium sp.]|nr:VOC family protein [Mycobacterium sp.]
VQAELEGRGVPIAREARREPWGLHEMHVTDPDGVTLIFVEVPPDHPLRRDTRRDDAERSDEEERRT